MSDNRNTNSFPSAAAAVVLCVLSAVVIFWLLGGVSRSRDEPRAVRIMCINNLKQIGLSFRQWALDHGDQYPFNVSASAGGTMESCAVGSDGFESNAAFHFQVMSNELWTPKILVCPQDRSRQPASDFTSFQDSNVTYRVHSGTKLSGINPTAVLVVCPIDGNALYCDGSVKEGKNSKGK